MSLENVSRETLDDIETFERLIIKWSKSINLISKSTIPELRTRHIEDSSDLYYLIPSDAQKVVDIGSGGGLPGLVLAILAKDKDSETRFTLIESDQRKSAFLRSVASDLNLDIDIVSDRIEIAKPCSADVLTARALAPLPKLLGYIFRHIKPDGVALLPKGKNHLSELALAKEVWDFDVEIIPSKREEGSVVLRLTDLKEKIQNGP